MRVVEARRVAEVELVERADQLVAIVGERAAQLDLVVEGADLRPVDRQQAQQELLGRLIQQLEIARSCWRWCRASRRP